MKEIKIVFPSRARACKRLYLVNACDRKGKCSNIYKHLVQHRLITSWDKTGYRQFCYYLGKIMMYNNERVLIDEVQIGSNV